MGQTLQYRKDASVGFAQMGSQVTRERWVARVVTCNGHHCPVPCPRCQRRSCGASRWIPPGIPTSASRRGRARQLVEVPLPPCFHLHCHFSPLLSLRVSFAPIMENRVSEPVIKGCAVPYCVHTRIKAAQAALECMVLPFK